LGLPGPQRIGVSLELAFIPQLLFSRIKSKFDAMKVFSIFRGEKISWLPNFYFPHEKLSWGFAPTYFHGENNKHGHPTYFFSQIVKTFMASNLLFIFENKSWGYKSNPKQITKSCGPRQSQGEMQGFSFLLGIRERFYAGIAWPPCLAALP